MCTNTVRRAVRETLLSPTAPKSPPERAARDRTGTRGIGTVLRVLHNPTVTEPLPDELTRLLERLKAAERRS
jgi:hypothetical protein